MNEQFFAQNDKRVSHFGFAILFVFFYLIFHNTSIAFAALNLPKDLTAIEEYTFSGDESIEKVTIPDGVVRIGEHAFSGCNSLFLVIIPDSVISIHETAFDKCPIVQFKVYKDTYAEKWLKDQGKAFSYLDDDVHNQGDYTYSVGRNRALTITEYKGYETDTLIVPSNIDGYQVTRIGKEAFRHCNAKKIILPDTLIEICHQGFSYCDFQELILSESLTIIGSQAFSGCSQMRKMVIPDSVTDIQGNPFYGCSSLETIMINPNHPVYGIYQNALIQKSNMKLITIPFALVGETLTIPDGIKIIGDTAFGYSGPNLKTVIIPDSVEEIEGRAFCFSTVEHIEIGSGVKKMDYGPFTYCMSLKSVVIKEGTTEIGSCAFRHCDNLETITIPDSVTYIAYDAFSYDYYVTFIASPDSYAMQYAKEHEIGKVKKSGDYAYELNDDKATIKEYKGSETGTLIVPSTLDGYSVTKIGEQAFDNCEAVKIILPNTLVEIECQGFNFCSVQELVLPDSLKTIGSRAFSVCRNMQEITIPNSVTDIQGNPFYGCHSLKTITISANHPVYGLYKNALIQKSNMKLITIPFALLGETLKIPDGIKIISSNAFGNNGQNIKTIIIPDSVEEIESSVFSFSSVEYVEIGSGVKQMDYGPFTYCESLKTVVIKEGTTVIGSCAFRHCDNLETIYIPDSVVSIYEDAFDYDYYVSFIANPESFARNYANSKGIPCIAP